MPEMGKFMVGAGIVLVILGVLVSLNQAAWLGKLPGDISVKKENFSFYFPITTCILLSVLLTILLRFFKK